MNISADNYTAAEMTAFEADPRVVMMRALIARLCAELRVRTGRIPSFSTPKEWDHILGTAYRAGYEAAWREDSMENPYVPLKHRAAFVAGLDAGRFAAGAEILRVMDGGRG